MEFCPFIELTDCMISISASCFVANVLGRCGELLALAWESRTVQRSRVAVPNRPRGIPSVIHRLTALFFLQALRRSQVFVNVKTKYVQVSFRYPGRQPH